MIRSLAFGLLIASLAGCRATLPSAGAPAPPAAFPVASIANHAFGDSVAHAARVLTFDRATETADVFVRSPDNVIVLAVEPGRDIEVIFPGGMTVKPLSKNTFTFFMQRFALVTKDNTPGSATQARVAYEQCMKNRAADIREQTRVQSRRDSTGRVIASTATAYQREPRTCDLMPEASSRTSVAQSPMPPREPRERYLVLLSSSTPVSLAELNERLATLTTIAPDVALTIEAIAAGIYAGKAGSWGGTFTSW